jgi:hypothetical protein
LLLGLALGSDEGAEFGTLLGSKDGFKLGLLLGLALGSDEGAELGTLRGQSGTLSMKANLSVVKSRCVSVKLSWVTSVSSMI